LEDLLCSFMEGFSGIFFNSVIWFSCTKLFVFCSRTSVCIMATALFLSALTIVRLFLCKMSLTWLMLYWILLCSVLYTFDVRICWILVAARYRIGLCILGQPSHVTYRLLPLTIVLNSSHQVHTPQGKSRSTSSIIIQVSNFLTTPYKFNIPFHITVQISRCQTPNTHTKHHK